MNNPSQFQKFVSDPRLARVIDSLKKTNNIFDIIEHKENQHSEILKWLFDPREGHGQNDAIFKDFLIAAYWAAQENVYSNKDFFRKWTPSRIARTGFNSIVLNREFELPSGKRLDLVLTDYENKIIVIIENKRGAKLNDLQIESYFDEVSKEIRSRPVFNEFLTAHIVLDQYHDIDENSYVKAPRNRWAFLDYQWLEDSARRAEFQFKRGNISSALVISYCRSQCDYYSDEERESDGILADLADDFNGLMREFEGVASIDMTNLKPSDMNQERGEIWLFSKNYSELVARMKEKTHLAIIENKITKQFEDEEIETSYARTKMKIWNREWESLASAEADLYPFTLYIRQKKITKADPQFSFSILYASSMLSNQIEERVKECIEELFPTSSTRYQNAKIRKLSIARDLSKEETIKIAIESFQKLNDKLRPFFS